MVYPKGFLRNDVAVFSKRRRSGSVKRPFEALRIQFKQPPDSVV
jgi:hypothetical protein